MTNLKSTKSHPNPHLHLCLPVIGKHMSCDAPVWLPQTRPPRDIDFPVSLTPWVNMLSLLVHKSYMRVHMHTRIIPAAFKLPASVMITQTTFISLHSAE